MDPRTVEAIAAEAAFLVMGGWTLFNGQWTHPTRPGLRYDREVAVGIQRMREKSESFARARAQKGRTLSYLERPSERPTTPPPATPQGEENGVEEVFAEGALSRTRDPRRE